MLSETGVAGRLGEATDEETVFHGEVGTVYLAVSTPQGEFSRVVKTGVRQRCVNMQEFAKLGLEFLVEVLQGLVKKEAEEQDVVKHAEEATDTAETSVKKAKK